jgi:hypothetical protein
MWPARLDTFIMARCAAIAARLNYLFGWNQFAIARGLVFVSGFLCTIWFIVASVPFNLGSLLVGMSALGWMSVGYMKLSQIAFEQKRAVALPEVHLFLSAAMWKIRLASLFMFITLDVVLVSAMIWIHAYPAVFFHAWGTFFGVADYFVYLPLRPEQKRLDWWSLFRRPVPHAA